MTFLLPSSLIKSVELLQLKDKCLILAGCKSCIVVCFNLLYFVELYVVKFFNIMMIKNICQ